MDIKERIINLLKTETENVSEKLEKLISNYLVGEFKSGGYNKTILSEGSKNQINASDITYALAKKNSAYFCIENTEVYSCLYSPLYKVDKNGKTEKNEVLELLTRKSINIDKLMSNVKSDLCKEISGEVELINLNCSNKADWINNVIPSLISNKKINSVNGIPSDGIRKIEKLCNEYEYSEEKKNKVINEFLAYQNLEMLSSVVVEKDGDKYVVDEKGFKNVGFYLLEHYKNYNGKSVNPFEMVEIENKQAYDWIKEKKFPDEVIKYALPFLTNEFDNLKQFTNDTNMLVAQITKGIYEYSEVIKNVEYGSKVIIIADASSKYKEADPNFYPSGRTIGFIFSEDSNDETCRKIAKEIAEEFEKFQSICSGINGESRIERFEKGIKKIEGYLDDFDNALGPMTFAVDYNYRIMGNENLKKTSKELNEVGNRLTLLKLGLSFVDGGLSYAQGDIEGGSYELAEGGFSALISLGVGATGPLGWLAYTYFDHMVKNKTGKSIDEHIAKFYCDKAPDVIADVIAYFIPDRATKLRRIAEMEAWMYEKRTGEKVSYIKFMPMIRDPLILDLNGTGFVTTLNKDGVHFDLNCDGFAERINWTTENGLLALDLNGNGMIDDGGEVFGDSTLLPDGSRAKNGFEALAQYDLNQDGIIDENDEIYERLKVWVDANASGESEEGELKSLKELGIKAINLNYEAVNEKTDTEVVIGNRATYIKEDGSEMAIGEMWVAPALMDSVEKMTPGIAEKLDGLPDVRSYGTVSSLHSAMEKDETGELKELVEQFTNADTYDEKLKITDSILYFICGVKDIDDSKMWGYAKEKELKVIERMTGEEYIDHEGSRYPNNAAGPILSELYKDIRNMYCISMVGSEASDLLNLIFAIEEDGKTEINVDMVNFAIGMGYQTGIVSERQIASVCSYLSYFGALYLNDLTPFMKIRDYVSCYIPECLDYIDANIMGAIYGTAEGERILGNKNTNLIYGLDGDDEIYSNDGNNMVFGGNGNDKISTGAGDDIIIGGKGNDRLIGYKGADTYIHERGDGSDIIDNRDTSIYRTSDKLVLKGVKISDINIIRDDYDLLVIDTIANETITIEGAFYSADGSQYLENIELDDGLLGKEDIEKLSLQIKGTDGNDKICMPQRSYNYSACETIDAGDGDDVVYANVGNDVIIGGKGNDELAGGEGIDIYIHERGDGNDIIDNVDHSEYRSSDKLVLKGVKAADVEIYRDGYNLVIEDKISDETVTIKNVFSYDYISGTACLENVELDDVTYNLEDLRRFTSVIKLGDDSDYVIGNEETYAYSADETFYTGLGNDYVYGETGDDVIHGETGDDHLSGGIGNDTIYGGDGDDTIYGDDGDDSLFGGAERDKIYAGDGDDFISGGTDNDILVGGSGDDTYHFNLGDGIDEVTDIEDNKDSFNAEKYNNDRFIFGKEIKQEDIVKNRYFNDLIIKYSNDDQITIKDAYDLSANHYIESFEFEDGSIMSFDEIYSGPNDQ